MQDDLYVKRDLSVLILDKSAARFCAILIEASTFPIPLDAAWPPFLMTAVFLPYIEHIFLTYMFDGARLKIKDKPNIGLC